MIAPNLPKPSHTSARERRNCPPQMGGIRKNNITPKTIWKQH
jgi:hypothetical protein